MEKNNCLNNVSNLKLSGSAVYSCFRKNTLFSKSQVSIVIILNYFIRKLCLSLMNLQRCDTKSVDTTQNNASNILPETGNFCKIGSTLVFEQIFTISQFLPQSFLPKHALKTVILKLD